MAAGVFDIELARNGSWNKGFRVHAENDAIVDLTGATFDLDIKMVRGTPGLPSLINNIPVVCETPISGYFEVALSGSQFDGLGNAHSNSRFVYDLIATKNGKKFPLLSGIILLTPGVSNNA